MMYQNRAKGKVFAILLGVVMAVAGVALTGCGPKDPTEGLDRVPNVPPSTRGTEDNSRTPGKPGG